MIKKNGPCKLSLIGLERTSEASISLGAKFLYDNPITRSIGMSPFKVNSRKPLALLSLSHVKVSESV